MTLVLAFAVIPLAQTQEGEVMRMAEYMPSLEGCQTKKEIMARRNCTKEKITETLAASLKYPSEAAKAGEEGTAVVSITIDAEGAVTAMTVVDDPGYGMGEAAMKALKKLSKQWYPGEHFGEKVAVEFKVPVTFELPEEEEEPVPVVKPDVYKVVDQMPTFGDCEAGDKQCSFKAVIAYFSENLKYPEEAETAGTEGTVNTSFIIDTEGNVTDVQILQGIGGGCDEEAVRLLTEMPVWTPGMHEGEAVKVSYELPVRFQMRGKE